MKSSRVYWCEVPEATPFSMWWSEFTTKETALKDLEIERWDASTAKWSQILDSLRSFTLFSKGKVVLLQHSEKLLKGLKPKQQEALWADLHSISQTLILQSSETQPKAWPYKFWKSEYTEEVIDDKAIFKWLDSIQTGQFQRSLDELEVCIQSGNHPLVCLQMLTRNLRMGRLIQYATQKGMSETEVQDRLKIHRFIIQKWRRAKRLSETQWKLVFERLLRVDLQLKSGADSMWSLRQLSFDIIRIQNTTTGLSRYASKISPETFA